MYTAWTLGEIGFSVCVYEIQAVQIRALYKT